MPDFTWSERAGRFRDDRGRFVPEARVRSGVDALVDHGAVRASALADGVKDGSLPLAEFQSGMFRIIKDVHVASALAAYGGRDAMTPSRWGTVGNYIKTQYRYARGMTQDVASGRQAADGRLNVRATMYASAGRVTYETIRAKEQKERGNTEARNILHAQESCEQCTKIATSGWMPLDRMVPIGSRQCLTRCKCTLEFR